MEENVQSSPRSTRDEHDEPELAADSEHARFSPSLPYQPEPAPLDRQPLDETSVLDPLGAALFGAVVRTGVAPSGADDFDEEIIDEEAACEPEAE